MTSRTRRALPRVIAVAAIEAGLAMAFARVGAARVFEVAGAAHDPSRLASGLFGYVDTVRPASMAATFAPSLALLAGWLLLEPLVLTAFVGAHGRPAGTLLRRALAVVTTRLVGFVVFVIPALVFGLLGTCAHLALAARVDPRPHDLVLLGLGLAAVCLGAYLAFLADLAAIHASGIEPRAVEGWLAARDVGSARLVGARLLAAATGVGIALAATGVSTDGGAIAGAATVVSTFATVLVRSVYVGAALERLEARRDGSGIRLES